MVSKTWKRAVNYAIDHRHCLRASESEINIIHNYTTLITANEAIDCEREEIQKNYENDLKQSKERANQTHSVDFSDLDFII